MSFEDYLSDEAIGSHDHSDILENPVQFYAKSRNKEWEALQRAHMTERELKKADEVSAAKAFGTALHAMVLEPETFDNLYLPEPDRPAWPGKTDDIAQAIISAGGSPPTALKTDYERACDMAGLPKGTVTQMKMHLMASGMPIPSDDLAAHIRTARALGIKTAADWDDELDHIAAGRQRISPRWYMFLKMLERAIERHSTAKGYVSGGQSEISVFWTDDTGLRLKCRFDHIRVKVFTNVKTFGWRPGRGSVVEQFVSAMDNFAYDLGEAHYMDCRLNAIPQLVEAGRIFHCVSGSFESLEQVMASASDAHIDFFRKVAAYDKPQVCFLGCLTNAYPEVHPILFPDALMRFQAAQWQVSEARRIYRDYAERFNGGEPWVSDVGTIILNDEMLSNRRALNRGSAAWETV